MSLLKQSLKHNGNDPDQAWYWTPKWQQEEREAEEDLRNGHYRDFNSMDELINDLSGYRETQKNGRTERLQKFISNTN